MGRDVSDDRSTVTARSKAAIASIPCPFCKAAVGQKCRALRRRGGSPEFLQSYINRAHKERLRAHEDQA